MLPWKASVAPSATNVVPNVWLKAKSWAATNTPWLTNVWLNAFEPDRVNVPVSFLMTLLLLFATAVVVTIGIAVPLGGGAAGWKRAVSPEPPPPSELAYTIL